MSRAAECAPLELQVKITREFKQLRCLQRVFRGAGKSPKMLCRGEQVKYACHTHNYGKLQRNRVLQIDPDQTGPVDTTPVSF
jgi:hypothetical protein